VYGTPAFEPGLPGAELEGPVAASPAPALLLSDEAPTYFGMLCAAYVPSA
jgi:hypothetical protein